MTGRQKRILLTLSLGVFMGALDISIVAPAFEAIQQTFSVATRYMTWIITAYLLAYIVGTPLMAKLSDRYGRRSIYTLDVGLFAVGSIVAGLSPSFPIFLAGRAIQAIGAGGIFPVASAVIGDIFPPERRGGALGIIGALWGVAAIVGPAVGGYIVQSLSWHWVFFINLPLAALIIATGWSVLPGAISKDRQPFDWAGMALLAVALLSLMWGLTGIDSNHLVSSVRSRTIWPFLLLGIALLPVFRFVEERVPDPVVAPHLMERRQLVVANILSLMAGVAESGFFFLPTLIALTLGYPIARAGAITSILAVVMFFATPAVGQILDRIGSRRVLSAGTLLTGLGLIWLSLWARSLLGFGIALVLNGIGLSSLLGAPVRYVIVNEATHHERGAALAVQSIFTSVGTSLGSVIAGAVASSYATQVQGFHAAYLVLGSFVALSVVFTLLLKSHGEELRTARAAVGP
jgi:EmrB/QacA subfamily drug resistance transporter